MTALQQITAIVGDEQEAREILEEAFDIVEWREVPHQNPYRLAQLLAEHHVKQRNRYGLLRRYFNR